MELAYYRLQRVSSGAISLGEEDQEFVVSPTEVGTGNPEEDLAPLSEIIKRLNERFGTEFTDEDRFFFEQVKERGLSATSTSVGPPARTRWTSSAWASGPRSES